MKTTPKNQRHPQASSTKVAVIGDVHGCLDELRALVAKLRGEGVEHIWHLGDLVDRGPDSGGVVRFCMEEGIGGVMGNHESTILALYPGVKSGAKKASPDKTRTISQLGDEEKRYLEALPLLHVFDDLKVVLVHAGLEPRLPVWKSRLPMHHFFGSQTHNVCHLQLVHPDFPGQTRWWGYDPKNDVPEEENRRQGWVRWYELYDEPYTVAYGHSVFYGAPFQHGRTFGIDTGCVFGGGLTALVLPDMRYVRVPSRRAYCERKLNSKTPYNTDP